MATGNAPNQKGDDNADIKALKEQFEILKNDMKAMTELIGTTATNRAESVKDDAIARMELMGNRARARVGGLQTDAERAVAANPIMALAISAGVGYLLGALSRK